MHVKTGDEVLIISGRNKGQQGKIKEARPKESRVIVENVNIIKKHMKARGARQRGGIIEVEGPLHVSNVQLICPNCKKAVRTGHRALEGGRKVRFCKVCDSTID